MAEAAVCRYGPAGLPITGHLLMSFPSVLDLESLDFSWANTNAKGVRINAARNAAVRVFFFIFINRYSWFWFSPSSNSNAQSRKLGMIPMHNLNPCYANSA